MGGVSLMLRPCEVQFASLDHIIIVACTGSYRLKSSINHLPLCFHDRFDIF